MAPTSTSKLSPLPIARWRHHRPQRANVQQAAARAVCGSLEASNAQKAASRSMTATTTTTSQLKAAVNLVRVNNNNNSNKNNEETLATIIISLSAAALIFAITFLLVTQASGVPSSSSHAAVISKSLRASEPPPSSEQEAIFQEHESEQDAQQQQQQTIIASDDEHQPESLEYAHDGRSSSAQLAAPTTNRSAASARRMLIVATNNDNNRPQLAGFSLNDSSTINGELKRARRQMGQYTVPSCSSGDCLQFDLTAGAVKQAVPNRQQQQQQPQPQPHFDGFLVSRRAEPPRLSSFNAHASSSGYPMGNNNNYDHDTSDAARARPTTDGAHQAADTKRRRDRTLRHHKQQQQQQYDNFIDYSSSPLERPNQSLDRVTARTRGGQYSVNSAHSLLQHHQQQQQKLYDAPNAVEPPHSDARCPMRWPLTVCDQIGAYPADLIVNRLQLAQRQLGQSYFNIDSFFSDERDHLTEPFGVGPSDELAALARGHKLAKVHRERRPPASTNATTVLKGKVKQVVPVQEYSVSNKKYAHSASGANYGAHDARQQQDGAASSSASTDEFLHLVERNGLPALTTTAAIRLHHLSPTTDQSFSALPDSRPTLARRRRHANGTHDSKSRLARQAETQPAGEDVGPTNNDNEMAPDNGSSAGAEQPVCRAKSIYITPRAALNDKKQWKFVVNAPERDPRIRQIIRVDVCEDPFGPCSDLVSLPLGFASQCKQKYAKKKLLALDARSGLLEVDTFFIPSCCVCKLVPAGQEQPDSATGTEEPDTREDERPTDRPAAASGLAEQPNESA